MAQAAAAVNRQDSRPTPRATAPALEPRQSANDPALGRVDLYEGVHKGLRDLMSDVLSAVGRLDAYDPAEVAATVEQVRGLLDACRFHLHKENQFLHPAMEARRPGSASPIAAEHVHHEEAIERLAADILAVERSTGEARAAAALTLYRRLALFVAENLEHMHVEETENNAVLWAAYTDEELREIEQMLLASVPPQWLAVFLRWMVPAMSPAERAGLMTGIQSGAPAEVFRGILAMVKPHLGERDWAKLMAAIAPLPMGG